MTQGPTPPQSPTPSPQTPLSYFPTSLPPGFNWGDFFAFRTMITTTIIQIIFWLAVAAAVLMGLGMILGGLFKISEGGIGLILAGLVWLVLGPVLIRVYCELLIVIFRINDTLGEIKRAVER